MRGAAKLSALLVGALLVGVAGCDPVPDEAYYRPSEEKFVFDFEGESSFEDYVARNTAYLRRHRIYYDAEEMDAELRRIAPYELPIPAGCEEAPSRGALLIHGILDTAYALRDIAEFLNSECVLARGMLLPGHGTRAGDLLQVDREEWIAAVDFGIRSLKAEVEQVYVAGFSLGGLLATHAATEHPDLSGLILLAPSLEIAPPALLWQARWLRHFRDWIDVDTHAHPVRYHSTPFNALAELVALRSETMRALRRERGIKPAVFAMLSEHDFTIDSEKTLELLEKASAHEESRFLYYGGDGVGRGDARTEYRNSYLPEERVLNFSHVSFHYAPENPLFGENGAWKECGQNIGIIAPEAAERCLAAEAPWKGELGSTDEPEFLPLQRLTYNPVFHRMKAEMLSFMEDTGG